MLPKFYLFKTDFLLGDLDIVVVTESWLRDSIPESLVFEQGYNMVSKDRTANTACGKRKNGGGIILHIKEDIEFQMVDLKLGE